MILIIHSNFRGMDELSILSEIESLIILTNLIKNIKLIR